MSLSEAVLIPKGLARRALTLSRERGLFSVLFGAAQVFAIRTGGAGLAYLSMILLARWLGASAFGVYAYVWVLIGIAGAFAVAGVHLVRLTLSSRLLWRGGNGAGSAGSCARAMRSYWSRASSVRFSALGLLLLFKGAIGPMLFRALPARPRLLAAGDDYLAIRNHGAGFRLDASCLHPRLHFAARWF